MLALLIAGLLAGDSTYTTPALRRFVAEAAKSCVPAELDGYRATLETDVAVLVTDVQGREHATQLEQMESQLEWRRSGELRQHVTGYRSRGGPTLSALSLMRRPWVLPSLYDKQLRLVLGSSALEGVSEGRVIGVHPLAADRDSVYRFSGGDTLVVMLSGSRRITLVRVYVTPMSSASTKLLVFNGYLDIDAERSQIVHMRGELGVLTHQSILTRAREAAIRRTVFVDIVDGEFSGRYWLPTYQRVDVQAHSSLSEGFRPGFRVVTRFRDHRVDTLTMAAGANDSGPTKRGVLTFSPSDSLNAFTGWQNEIGENATMVTATDFDDVGSKAGVVQKRPGLQWRAQQLSDVFRYDKVEGVYAGVAGRIQSGDTASVMFTGAGHGGWAKAESVARGAGSLRWKSRRWTAELAGQRELENTSDFVPPLEGPATIGALLVSVDDYDYVDRANGRVALTYAPDAKGRRSLRFGVESGRDAAVRTNVSRGLVLWDSTFRPNRPVTEGSYTREFVAFTLNPGVSGDYLEPGVGVDLSYERGDGRLRWQRVEGLTAARHTLGSFTYFGRLDAVAVFGPAPYQRLIEFGENEGMPGFGYKEFGGDRAAIGHVGLSYSLPFLKTPLHPWRWVTLPGPSPAITLGVQGGWAAATSEDTRRSFALVGYKVGTTGSPILRTRPTDGVRSSVAVAFDFFGGAIGLGVAHKLDRRGGWVVILGSQQW